MVRDRRMHGKVRRRVQFSVPETPVDIAALLEYSLQERLAVFVRQLRRARRRCTEPAIHDLRVATRRLIAMLDILAPLLPQRRVRPVRRRLKRLLKSFNELRDIHVQRIAARSTIRRYSVLRYYRSALITAERRLVREGARRVVTFAQDDLVREIAALQSDLQALFAVPGMSGAGEWLVRGAVAAAYRTAVQCRWAAVPSNITSIHKLRVAFKKLRYTLEILQPLMPSVQKETLKAMNAYQTAMGEIQDAEVFLTSVRRFARSSSVPLPISWLPVTQELAQRRSAQIAEFMKQADRLYDFWPGARMARVASGPHS